LRPLGRLRLTVEDILAVVIMRKPLAAAKFCVDADVM
jgi:hypothetical protein